MVCVVVDVSGIFKDCTGRALKGETIKYIVDFDI